MRQSRRSTVAALLLITATVLGTAACTGDDADAKPDTADTAAAGATLEWPEAIDPATTTDKFWVVWAEIVDTGDGATEKLQPTIDKLAELGYTTLPWDPACQTGAEESLGGLTSFADPLAVGIAFASAQDAGEFSTLYGGAGGSTQSVTEGTWTCGAA